MRSVMLVLVAVLVVGCGSSSSGGGSVNTKAIALPATLAGGYKDIVDVAKASGSGTFQTTQTQLQDSARTLTEAAYKKAYGGAAVAYREYSDANPDASKERRPWVIAVRAKSPGMVIGPVVDPKLLQLANAQREVTDVGQVQCEVTWNPITPAGQKPPPDSEIPFECQRTGNDLTVFVGAGAGFTGQDGLKAMADLTNTAWDAVS